MNWEPKTETGPTVPLQHNVNHSILYHRNTTVIINTQWSNYINYGTNCCNETQKQLPCRTSCLMSQIQHESCLSHWPNFTMGPLKKQGRSVQFGLEIKKKKKKKNNNNCNQLQKPVSWLRELNWSLYDWIKQTTSFPCDSLCLVDPVSPRKWARPLSICSTHC